MASRLDPKEGIKVVQKGYKTPMGIENMPGIEDAQIVPYGPTSPQAQYEQQVRRNLAAYAESGRWPNEETRQSSQPAPAPAFTLAGVSKVLLVAGGLYMAFQMLVWVGSAIVAWWKATDFTPVLVVLFVSGMLLLLAKMVMGLRTGTREQDEPTQQQEQTTCMPQGGGNIIINNIINNQK